jgi:hypothetical protein
VKGLRDLWDRWFGLTAEEKRFLAGLLAIALTGLVARYVHLRREAAEPYQPAGAPPPAAAEAGE